MRTSGLTTGYVRTTTYSSVVLVLQYDQDSNTCSALVLSRQARTGPGNRLTEVLEVDEDEGEDEGEDDD